MLAHERMHQSSKAQQWRRTNNNNSTSAAVAAAEQCLRLQLNPAAAKVTTRPPVALLEDEDRTTTSNAALTVVGDIDDDVVVEPYTSDSVSLSMDDDTVTASVLKASSEQQALHKQQHRVGADVIELVTDEFRAVREREVERRRKFLYNLTHPVPEHYTYAGKLLPPPPLAFGVVPQESVDLGREIMIGQHYSKVVSAPSSNYFFEINDLYMEIVMVGRANAGKSSLINSLLGQPEMAKTSSTPNSTREVTFYQSVSPDQLKEFANRNPNKLVKLPGGGLQLTFVDLPGFGIEGMSEAWRDNAIACTDSYLGTRRSVNTVLFCIDCDLGLTKTDITYMEWLENLHGVFWIVLTKCDSVPHSRVCSVMRQVYELITKNRRKFRKAFPFVLPVSAKDGTNMDMLRGLIAETSGMVPGDKLRELLKARAKLALDDAGVAEEERLWEMWNENRREARKALRLKHNSDPLLEEGVNTAEPSRRCGVQKAVTLQLTGQESRPARPRTVLPYGGGTVKLHDGFSDDAIEVAFETPSPLSPPLNATEEGDARVDGERQEDAVAQAQQQQQPHSGGGRVTQFLDTLDGFQNTPTKSQQRKQQRREQLSQGGGRISSGDVGSVSVITETTRASSFVTSGNAVNHAGHAPGRLTKTKLALRHCRVGGAGLKDAAKRHPPSAAAVQSGDRPQPGEAVNAWRARRYAQVAARENPTAPWDALPSLKKKEETLRQSAAVSNMSKKDLAAYLRNRGSIINGFEAFENQVTATKYMNETRRVKTLRSQAQLELNAQDKISYASQPAGLLKSYGSQGTFRPTSSIIGLK